MLTPSQSAQPVGNPLVTMIVLCYNQARFAVETLESVKAQTYKNTELVIVDDCSSDDSVAVIERWLQENRIQCNFIRHQKNQGICKSLNEALRLTTGKYISMIAADDIWLPDKIERQVAIMESQPESVGVLYSDAFRIDENGQCASLLLIASSDYWKLPKLPEGHILDVLMRGNFVPGMTTLIRRSCYAKVGSYDENLPWEDWDMWMRIARQYSFLALAAPVAKYRVHAKSISHSNHVRMAKEGISIGLKQFALGDLTHAQKTSLSRTLLRFALDVYGAGDPDTPSILLVLLRAGGGARCGYMYLFAKAGIPYKLWLRANNWRLGLRRVFTGRQQEA